MSHPILTQWESVAVGELAPHLSPVWLEKLLDITKGIDDSRNRADALRDLREHLPTELVGVALEVAQGIEDIHNLAWAFRVLLPDLPSQFVQQALDIIQTMEDNPKEWAESISYLAPYISEQELFKILAILSNLEPSWTHVHVFEKIAPHFPLSRLNEASDLIFEASEHTIIRSELVRILAPYLSHEILIEILTATQKSSDTTFKPWILRAVVFHLPPEYLSQALVIAKAIPSNPNRAQALCLITEFLPSHLKQDAIDTALAAAREDSTFQVSSLSNIVPLLPHQKQAEIVDEAISALERDFSFRRPGENLMPMIMVINNLSEQAQIKLTEALIELTGVAGFGMLDRLVMAWEKNNLSDPLDERRLWCLILRSQCKWASRPLLLRGLSSLVPILGEMCNPADISYIIQSVETVGEKWP